MTRAGAHVRSGKGLREAVAEAWAQWLRLEGTGCSYDGPREVREALRNRQLCFAHAVYLEAISYAVQSGVGSRGSAIVLDKERHPGPRQAGREVAHRTRESRLPRKGAGDGGLLGRGRSAKGRERMGGPQADSCDGRLVRDGLGAIS